MQKFNYHSHTYRCGHAQFDMMDEEYVEEYIKMGFEKIAFTDHCPEEVIRDFRPGVRMDYSQKSEYIHSIEKLKEKYKGKIKIETGFEVEYLEDNEEYLLRLKKECDKIILGQHFFYNDNKLRFIGSDVLTDEDIISYAKHIETAMKIHFPDIVAHPDMYMVGKKVFGNAESKVANIICKSAQTYNIPLEINISNIFYNTYLDKNKVLNNDPIEVQRQRLKNVFYPCKEFWEIATKYDIKVVYGIDAHFRGQIMLFNELVLLANEIIGKEVIEKLNFTQM